MGYNITRGHPITQKIVDGAIFIESPTQTSANSTAIRRALENGTPDYTSTYISVLDYIYKNIRTYGFFINQAIKHTYFDKIIKSREASMKSAKINNIIIRSTVCFFTILESLNKSDSITWFNKLFGFNEGPHQFNKTKEQFNKDLLGNQVLVSQVNNQAYYVGKFTTPTLNELRNAGIAEIKKRGSGKTTYSHQDIGDVLLIHYNNTGATFQAASQFNCLEFANTRLTPSHGITIYEKDLTQGPACALACAAGTVVRNYFEQTPTNQINLLDDVQEATPNFDTKNYWTITNGYSFTEPDGSKMDDFKQLLDDNSNLRNILLSKIKIGLHKNVGVTFKDRFTKLNENELVTVTQVYASALAVAKHYS